VDFIQNPAIEGTQLQRKGNDLVALVFPPPLAPGQELKLRFTMRATFCRRRATDCSMWASAAPGIRISV
jgi:hypothetical protein